MAETPCIDTLHLDGTPETLNLSERTLCSLKRNYDLHLLYVLTRTQGDRKDTARVLGGDPQAVTEKNRRDETGLGMGRLFA